MQNWKAAPVFVLGGVLVIGSATSAWTEDLSGREGFSGKQLFEHEWKWTGPATQPSRRFMLQVARRVAFDELDVRGDGLGPLHNATSCAACHPHGGG